MSPASTESPSRPTLADPRRPRPRPADGRPRRDDREHRAAPAPRTTSASPTSSRQWIVTAYALAFGSPPAARRPHRRPLRPQVGLHRGPGRLRRRLGASAAPRRASACSSAPAPCRALFGALLAPAALSLLTTTFTEPARAQQGVRRLRRDRRLRRRRRPAARRHPHRVPLLALVPVREPRLRRCRRLRRARAADQPAHPRASRAWTSPARSPRRPACSRLVYGFSHAETDGWGDTAHLGLLAGGVVLLAAFVAIQRRVRQPAAAAARRARPRPRRLVPRRRPVGASAIFGVFLFLTYYLQQNLGFSPIEDRRWRSCR